MTLFSTNGSEGNYITVISMKMTEKWREREGRERKREEKGESGEWNRTRGRKKKTGRGIRSKRDT